VCVCGVPSIGSSIKIAGIEALQESLNHKLSWRKWQPHHVHILQQLGKCVVRMQFVFQRRFEVAEFRNIWCSL
jgi:hypothetical protein